MQLDDEGKNSRPLSQRLHDWTYVDVAMYHLGVVLGVLPSDAKAPSEADHFMDNKHIFWSRNGLNDFLMDGLRGLVKAGVLEEQEGSLTFRFARRIPDDHSGGR